MIEQGIIIILILLIILFRHCLQCKQKLTVKNYPMGGGDAYWLWFDVLSIFPNKTIECFIDKFLADGFEQSEDYSLNIYELETPEEPSETNTMELLTENNKLIEGLKRKQVCITCHSEDILKKICKRLKEIMTLYAGGKHKRHITLGSMGDNAILGINPEKHSDYKKHVDYYIDNVEDSNYLSVPLTGMFYDIFQIDTKCNNAKKLFAEQDFKHIQIITNSNTLYVSYIPVVRKETDGKEIEDNSLVEAVKRALRIFALAFTNARYKRIIQDIVP